MSDLDACSLLSGPFRVTDFCGRWQQEIRGIFGERHLCTGVSIWMLCFPQRGEQPPPAGEQVSNAALVKSWLWTSHFLWVASSLKEAFCRCSCDCCRCWRCKWLTSANWIRNKLKRLPSACQKQLTLKSCGDTAPHNEAIHSHYTVAHRESDAFISTFEAFFWLLKYWKYFNDNQWDLI